MIRAIIFDCFGVLLVDSLKQLMDEVRRDDPEKGQELTDILHANHRGLITSQVAYSQLSEGLGFTGKAFHEWLDVGEIKNEPLMEYIRTLKQNYKTAMLSNIGKGSLRKRFTDAELTEHFDTVVLSGEVGFAKPEREIYEIAADQLGVRLSECVFTDDREEFCEAARSVGMQAIVFSDRAQFQAELESILANT